MNPDILQKDRQPAGKLSLRLWKFVAIVLAALLPGTGHLFIGLFIRGITLIVLLFLDLSAMLYVSSAVMPINVPLLVLLGLFIPVLYFYNVYDVLQSVDDRTFDKRKRWWDNPRRQPMQKRSRYKVWETRILFSILLMVSGTLIILFRIRPRWLEYFFSDYGFYLLAYLLIVIGVVVFIRELGVAFYYGRGRLLRKRERQTMQHKMSAGRYTASLLLVSVGILLFTDLMQNTDNMMKLLTWWPLLFVAWGAECVLFGCLYRRRAGDFKEKRCFKPDLKGMLLSVLLCASVFIITEQQHYTYLWSKVRLNLTDASMNFSEEQGNRFDKGGVLVPVGTETSALLVEGTSGNITVRRAAVQDVEVYTTMWIDQVMEKEAQAIADASSLQVANGNTIRIWTATPGYGQSGKRQPLMNMEIILPEKHPLNLDIRTSNGNITLTGGEAIHSIFLQTGHGSLTVNDVRADLQGTTLHGTVNVHKVAGNVEMSTDEGNMFAGDISGSTTLKTRAGDIQVARTEGDIKVSTQNGNIGIRGAHWKVDASSLNGGIDVQSSKVGGNWDVYSAVGNITLRLPVVGSFKLEGSSSYGDISADAPFKAEGKKVSGQVGDGQYGVHVEGNSNLTIRSVEMELPGLKPVMERAQ